jgi:hypothetical protein
MSTTANPRNQSTASMRRRAWGFAAGRGCVGSDGIGTGSAAFTEASDSIREPVGHVVR